MGAHVWATLGVVCVCGLTAIVATWPLAAHMMDAIPLGVENEATVPVFSLWTLWWNADRAASGFHGYWNAPMFHPIQGTLAFSEPQTLTGLMVAPLWWMSAPPALAYNFAFLTLLVLNGLFTFRLVRALGAARRAAAVAATIAVTLPFGAKHFGVLPVLPIFGMLWTLEGLVRFSDDGGPRHAAWAGAGLLAEFLTSQQLALIFAPFAVGAVVVALCRLRWRVRSVAWVVLCWLPAFAVIAAIAVPGRRLRETQGFQRRDAVVHELSASAVDFLLRPSGAVIPLPPAARPAHGDTAGLFPGAVLLALAVAGTAGAGRLPSQRAWTGYLVASCILAVVLAQGLKLEIAGWCPYAMLRLVSSEFAQLRSPYRFAAVLQMSLVPLAAFGLTVLGRLSERVAVTVGLFAAAENLAIPQRLQAVPVTPQMAWTAWLRSREEPAYLAHVPFPPGPHVSHYEIEASRLYAQIDHRRPMLNGYASYFPRAYTELQIEMAHRFPSQDLLCRLSSDWRVDTLVVDTWWLERHRAEMEAESVRALLDPIYADDVVKVYRLAPDSGPCANGGVGSNASAMLP